MAEAAKLIHDEMSLRIIEAAELLATEQGAQNLTVRKIIGTLGVTGRVFYNRFHNVEEVLDAVYKSTVLKIRESITARFDPEKDFFDQVLTIVTDTLILSYEAKRRFNQYVFENDSVGRENFDWWVTEIRKLILYAKEKGLIREVDTNAVSYSIWCFCRGFNADAVGRGLPKDEAVAKFRYGFGIFLDGLKQKM